MVMSTKNTKSSVWDKVLRWVKDVLPSVTLAASWIYNFMMRKVQEEKLAHIETNLEKEKLENEKSIDHTKSDSATIKDAIRRGRKLRDSDGEGSSGPESPGRSTNS